MAAATMIEALCPQCRHALPVRIGLKSTVRRARCADCGTGWDYSAWLLKVGQQPTGGIARIYRVEFEQVVRHVTDVRA